MTRFIPGRSTPLQHGFTLVEIVVVLLIVGILISMASMMTRGVVAAQKRSLTSTRIATVDAAIAQFASQQKRLPCPADGTLVSAHNNAGTEGPRSATNGCTSNQQGGVVPWRALALSEVEATDGWDRRLTYRVGPALAADSGMDMSSCDPAGSGPTQGANAFLCVSPCAAGSLATCTTPLRFMTKDFIGPGTVPSGKGLQVRNTSGAVLMNPNPTLPAEAHTGAAYIVISAGESGGGGYLSSGVLGTSVGGDGTEELKNYASLPFVSNMVTYYVDDSTNAVAGANHFDDVVSRPSILTVAAKAGLGPRTH